MSAKEVNALRKNGKYSQAKEPAYSLMERIPKDISSALTTRGTGVSRVPIQTSRGLK